MIKRDKTTGRFVSTKKSAQKKTTAKKAVKAPAKKATKCTKKVAAKSLNKKNIKVKK